jgi:TonB-linked SusC/RagA family outer membrane protein
MGRLAIFLLLIVCTHATARGYSQLVSFTGRNVPLQTVFNSLEKQTGMVFFYNYSLLKDTKPVTAEFKNVPLEIALNQVLKDQGLDFYESGKTIFIIKKQLETSPHNITESVAGEIILIDVKGKVMNQQGEPLPGATVAIKDGKKITLTDDKGMFELRKIPSKAILEVTYQGYQKKDVQIITGEMIQVEMELAKSKLDEVQVIAYGNTTQRLSTGDQTTIKATEIETEPVSNPILALEGRVPGMFIMQNSGLPGSASMVQVQIRGTNSLQHAGDPLYIVDGVPYVSETLTGGGSGAILLNTSGNPFNFLNPADIESITVLKDADATSIYGSRGANGVILITTKKGKDANTRIDINAQNGVGQVGHFIKLLNLRQYLDMRYEAFRNDGAIPNPNADFDLTLWDTTKNTDWQKELIGGTGHYNDIQTSFAGGNATTQFLLGGSFHTETTVFPGDWNDRKGSLHFTINNSTFQNRLKVFFSGNFIVDENDLGQVDLTQTALLLPPDAPKPVNSDGTLNWAPDAQGATTWPSAINPIAVNASKFNVTTDNLIGKASISYQVIPGCEIKTAMGYTNMQNNSFSDVPFAELDPSTWSYSQRNSRFGNNKIESWIVEPQASYSKDIANGLVTALIGTTIEQNTSQGQVYNASGFSSDLLMSNILAATTITAVSNTYNLYKYNAIFGRLNYDWRDSYLINLVIRRDGSSRFGPDNRFSNFYSGAGAWIFSKMALIQKNFPALSYGKIRASYGTTGNDQIGDYSYLDLYNSIANIGVPYQGVNGLRPTSLYTPNLQWELTRKMEAGLETGFFKDRVLFTLSYYFNRSSNQLLYYPLPSITGFTSVEENLPAIVQNTGTEIELSTVNLKKKNFRWTTSFNLSTNRNTLERIAPGLGGYFPELVGRSLRTIVLYHFAGVNPITGINQFQDSHGDLVSQPNAATDKIVFFDYNPKFYGGLQNSVIYKNFQLDILFQFVKQANMGYPFFGMPGVEANEPEAVLKRWQKPGDVTTLEKFSQNGSLIISNTYGQQSDQCYGDASYIRLKNVSLSYELRESAVHRLHLQSAHIFIHAQNLFTITNYSGLDPETLSITSLPPLRVITAGVQVTFH